MQHFNDVSTEKFREFAIKVEDMDAGDNVPIDCRKCAKVCYRNELNYENVCNECCFEDLDVKPFFLHEPTTTKKENPEPSGVQNLCDKIETDFDLQPRVILADTAARDREETLHAEIIEIKEEITTGDYSYTYGPLKVSHLKESPQAHNNEYQLHENINGKTTDEINLEIEKYIKKNENLNDYICTLCPETKIQKFSNVDGLRRHIRIDHYGYRYECTECENNSITWGTIRCHLKKVHNKVGPFKIELTIPREENKKINYKNYIKKITDKHFICTICGESKSVKYINMDCVRQHIKVVHYDFRYECSECNKRYTNSTVLKKHYRNVHNKECPKNLTLTRSCKMSEENTNQAVKNLLFGIQKVSDHYICTLCPALSSRKYSDRMSVRKHQRVTHYGYRYICTDCDTKFVTKINLRNHIKKKHNKEAPLKIKITKDPKLLEKCKEATSQIIKYKKFFKKMGSYCLCTLCPKSKMKKFNSEGHVRSHIQIRHLGCRYECTECKMKYCYISSIRRHYRSAHDMKRPRNLLQTKNHKLMAKINALKKETKSGISNVQSFIRNEAARTAVKSFAALKPRSEEKQQIAKIDNYYICTLCTEVHSKKYKVYKNVQRHLKIQHNSYRYACTDCDKYCTAKSRLRAHYAKEHNKNESITQMKLTKLKTQENFENINGNLICKLCPAGTKSQKYKYLSSMQRHIQIFHNGYRYECTECTMNYLNVSSLRRHYIIKHNFKKEDIPTFAKLAKEEFAPINKEKKKILTKHKSTKF